MLTSIKRFVPWLKEADSQVLQQKLKDVDRAYKNFFNGQSEYPKFKSKHQTQSIRYPQRFKVNGSRIYLPKVGHVRAVFHRPIEGKMKNCTVSQTATGNYYISIQCEVKNQDLAPKPGIVGVDLGLKHFAVLSTGEKIESPKHLRKAERRLKRLQRALSRKVKGSNSRHKARLKVARLHEHIANQRKDFAHKLSRDLVDRFGIIRLENLNVCGMLKNHHLAKSISDSGWSMFVRFCEYKAQWAGGMADRIDRFFPSSKTCNVCGWINQELKLHHRFWICGGCETLHDRDLNAALNIVAWEPREINAGGQVKDLVEAGSSSPFKVE